MSFVRAFSLLATVAASATALASGLEKGIMFGGRSAGVAGIATPYTQGAESLYFNPAGLVMEKQTNNIALDLSPTHPSFQGPITSNNSTAKSESKTLVPAALLFSRNLTESIGLGIGYYTSGGSYASYKDQMFGNFAAEEKTDVEVDEVALGAGYKVSDRLKLGLAYRIVMVKANLSTISSQGPVVINTKFTDLKDTEYTGFKLGAQYKLDDKTALGFTYRSNVPLKAKGSVGGTTNAVGPVADGSATIDTAFPDAYSLGVRHELTDKWNILGELVYTSYGRLRNFQVEGNIKIPGAAINSVNPATKLDWKDQQAVKLGGEYLGFGMPVRFGYAWTSRVTDHQFATAAFVPPGPAGTLTLGTGMAINEAINIDAAAEYTWADGDGHAAAKLGDYKVNEYALHLGAGYTF